jgi:nucleotide-binding universal stress UspA family protein
MTNASVSDRPVLIAYDGSDDARHAIEEAARLFPGAMTRVISVWQDIRSLPAYGWMAPATYDIGPLLDDARDAAAAKAAEGAALARERGLEATAEGVQAGGPVWAAIDATAEREEASAIVVGSRGFGGVRSALLGSVSAGLAHHAHRPVVVVRPADQPGGAS